MAHAHSMELSLAAPPPKARQRPQAGREGHAHGKAERHQQQRADPQLDYKRQTHQRVKYRRQHKHIEEQRRDDRQ